MEYKSVDIGKKIEEAIDAKKITRFEFANMVGVRPSNLCYQVLRRKSLDTDFLVRVSEALDVDFFAYYRPVDQHDDKTQNIYDHSSGTMDGDIFNLITQCDLNDSDLVQEDDGIFDEVYFLRKLLEDKEELIKYLKDTIKTKEQLIEVLIKNLTGFDIQTDITPGNQ